MRSFIDISYGKLKNPAQKLDVYLPECESFPVFIYFHGGGIEGGDKGHHPYMYEDLTSRGICVVSANYRMYPEAKYPEYLEDAAEAVKWVFDNIGRYGNVQKIIVSGTSAGGYISRMLCFDKRWLSAVGLSPTDVDAYIHDAGQPTTHFNLLKKEYGIDPKRIIIDEASPLYHVGEDDKYSPMLIIVSDNDMFNRYDQTMLLVSTLEQYGHGQSEVSLKVMHGTHCHYVSSKKAPGENVFALMVTDYIKKLN